MIVDVETSQFLFNKISLYIIANKNILPTVTQLGLKHMTLYRGPIGVTLNPTL